MHETLWFFIIFDEKSFNSLFFISDYKLYIPKRRSIIIISSSQQLQQLLFTMCSVRRLAGLMYSFIRGLHIPNSRKNTKKLFFFLLFVFTMLMMITAGSRYSEIGSETRRKKGKLLYWDNANESETIFNVPRPQNEKIIRRVKR